MIYILPVNQAQYMDYQKRIKGIQSDYSRTVGVENVKKVYLFQNGISDAKNSSTEKRVITKQKQKDQRIYAELTGIGNNFNVLI